MAIKLNPECHTGWYNKGLAFLKLGQYEESLRYYLKALLIKPDYANTLYSVACVYSLMLDAVQALEYLKRSVLIDPSLIELARRDEDFCLIQNDPDFKSFLDRS